MIFRRNGEKKWPAILAIASAIIAIFPWTYGIYVICKIPISLAATYYCFKSYKKNEKQEKYFWILLTIAILYNPLIPIHLFFSPLWVIADLIVVYFFWKKLIPKISSTVILSSTNMISSILTPQIHTHLDFLGYKVSLTKGDNLDTLLALHDIKSNLFFIITEQIVLIKVSYSLELDSKKVNQEFSNALNKINSTVTVSRWYWEINKETDNAAIVIESFFSHYEKQQFSNLLALLENEINNNISIFTSFK